MFDPGAEDAVGVEADRAAERDRLEGRVVDVSILGQAIRPFGTYRAGFAGDARRAICAGGSVDTGDALFPFKPLFAAFAIGAWRSFRSRDADFTLNALQALRARFPGFPNSSRLPFGSCRAGCSSLSCGSFCSSCAGRSRGALRSGGADFTLHARQPGWTRRPVGARSAGASFKTTRTGGALGASGSRLA